MKKRQILAVAAIAALVVSCDGGSVSTKPSLSTDTDTLAYAYGLDVAEKGLGQYIVQLGVVTDTASFRMGYEYKIEIETDSLTKATLLKALPAKIDSLKKANARNLDDFIKGLNKALSASEKDAAYMKGIQVGTQLQQMADGLSTHVFGEDSKEKINKKALLSGIVTILKNEKPLFENYSAIFESKMHAIEEAKVKEQYGADIEAGKKFMEENKAKEGVVTLPDGLQYKVITEGTGEKPTAGSQVKVHYTGTLIDGTVFDSSVERGEPAVFGVNQVIPGWTEALQLMPVGSKWLVYVPAELGYGSQSQGAIKPYSTLIFEVELLSIEK
ncbi:FKBP-type peptidyl-prolyl cis-trans isomerase [Viscerimonas tarda]